MTERLRLEMRHCEIAGSQLGQFDEMQPASNSKYETYAMVWSDGFPPYPVRNHCCPLAAILRKSRNLSHSSSILTGTGRGSQRPLRKSESGCARISPWIEDQHQAERTAHSRAPFQCGPPTQGPRGGICLMTFLLRVWMITLCLRVALRSFRRVFAPSRVGFGLAIVRSLRL